MSHWFLSAWGIKHLRVNYLWRRDRTELLVRWLMPSTYHSECFNIALPVHGWVQKAECIRIKMYFHIHLLSQQNLERPLPLPSNHLPTVKAMLGGLIVRASMWVFLLVHDSQTVTFPFYLCTSNRFTFTY